MMISYAGNREDVVLQRAFAGQAAGFYIDVGANDPVWGSVTKHFYDQGWRGIDIEPAPGLGARLRAERPEDIVLSVGVADKEGQLRLFEPEDPAFCALATFVPQEAEAHRISRGLSFRETQVPVTTLRRICDEHVRGPIDFISIDVEGGERQVLLGADLRRFRPRVLLIEATKPMVQVPTHESFEDLLLQAGYRFALYDGANRFYAREEEPELLERLRAPASGFDKFIPHEHHSAIAGLEASLAQAQAELARRQAEQARVQEELRRTQAELDAARARLFELRAVGPRLTYVADQISSFYQRHPQLSAALEGALRRLS
jgi:FkbM family methyltransferase